MSSEMTFFHTDSIERLTLEQIAREASRRGYRTRFSEDLREPTEIGVYCSHNADPRGARFSAVMLHDLGQRHDLWPYFWSQEPWNHYDVGFLPGRVWADRFLSAKRVNRFLAPRRGLFEVGWPKADPIFEPGGAFQREVSTLRETLGLSPDTKTVLYAPSWENDGKQDEFVAAALALDCNIVIKQADWPLSTHAHIARNIDEMEAKYRGHPRVKTIERKTSIMYALALADVLVSDESSVMVEALLFGVPAISVVDWLIPDQTPPRHASVPFDFVRRSRRSELSKDLSDVLTHGHQLNYRGENLSLEKYSDLWFSQRGGSAVLVMDILDATLSGRVAPAADVRQRPGYDGSDSSLIDATLHYLQAKSRYHVQTRQRWEQRVRRRIGRLLGHA